MRLRKNIKMKKGSSTNLEATALDRRTSRKSSVLLCFPAHLLPLGPCGAQLSTPGWVIPRPTATAETNLVLVCLQAGLPGVELTVDEAARLSWAGKGWPPPFPRVFLGFTPGRARLGESLEERDWTSGRLAPCLGNH